MPDPAIIQHSSLSATPYTHHANLQGICSEMLARSLTVLPLAHQRRSDLLGCLPRAFPMAHTHTHTCEISHMCTACILQGEVAMDAHPSL